MMREICSEDVERLSEIYDPDNEDSFISLYIDPESPYESFLKRREEACRCVLKKNPSLLENFDKTMERIRDVIMKNSSREFLIIFASHKNGFFEMYTSNQKGKNLMIVDTSPYIRPVVEMMEDYEDIGLILMDTHRAKVFMLCENKLVPEKEIARNILRKHKKGGWSQARFQRIRREEIKRFMKEVALYCEKIFKDVDKIILAGPGNGKHIFLETIPKSLRKKIIEILDVDFDEDERKLIEIMQDMGKEKKKEDEEMLMNRIGSEILKGGMAVYGVREVLERAMEGLLEVVLIDKNLRIAGWICERCQLVDVGRKERCPYCGSEVSEVDVIEEIVEFCERFDSRVIFLENEELEEIGGIAGLLRYRY
ncbi:MAG: hypothetical protein DRN19_01230 [Thermoplasmata archaeon]|nr:MAG: hypothetical protein DRN19_01230 [Thermoplasmata archaeon]